MVTFIFENSLQVKYPWVIAVVFQLVDELAIVGVGVVCQFVYNFVQCHSGAVRVVLVVNACATCHTVCGEHLLGKLGI